MQNLLFKQWLISEMADYGFDTYQNNKVMGGTEKEPGEEVFKKINTSKIMSELTKLPSIGPNHSNHSWEHVVEWGYGPGAIKIEIAPLGSSRLITRRKIKDLQGEDAWICKNVRGLKDVKDQDKEIGIAQDMHELATNISQEMIEGPDKEFPDFNRLAWKTWQSVKKTHPSYCMYPVSLRKQNENYYKMIFEYRGHGQGHVDSGSNGMLQYDIDLFWDKEKGLIRCFGYGIETNNGPSWNIAQQEWNEFFSPHQSSEEIIECIINTFMQY